MTALLENVTTLSHIECLLDQYSYVPENIQIISRLFNPVFTTVAAADDERELLTIEGGWG